MEELGMALTDTCLDKVERDVTEAATAMREGEEMTIVQEDRPLLEDIVDETGAERDSIDTEADQELHLPAVADTEIRVQEETMMTTCHCREGHQGMYQTFKSLCWTISTGEWILSDPVDIH